MKRTIVLLFALAAAGLCAFAQSNEFVDSLLESEEVTMG